VSTPTHPTLAGLIQHWLGTDRIPRLESTMARINDALNALVAQQEQASAAQLTSFSNLQAGVDRLKAVVDRLQEQVEDPELTGEAQAAMDQLTSGFDSMVRDAQRADDVVEEPTGGETPAPVDETIPVEGDAARG
jgi:uncharacterized phage infection (PIP) family protein YhgE